MMFHDAELSTIAVFFYRSCTCCDCRCRKIVHAVWFLHFFLTLHTVRHEQVLQSEQYLSLFLVFLFFPSPARLKELNIFPFQVLDLDFQETLTILNSYSVDAFQKRKEKERLYIRRLKKREGEEKNESFLSET